ncbi:MAG: EAL domain-containing protein [Roseiflexus sp.]|nr:EAL domain-containing protein [Roseiflexus sp.]MCS7289340.1 EAL domain-containing protein [Roseiflexus sp.]MDW8146406.1 EAL domain-containing protein [Roseiflexaceae bacterium]MDW8233666.1 EAL domain-containing protein [Roseiflexaceae bacterium]
MSPSGHILVVDDHDYVRNALARQLERAGHTVVVRSDGIAALEAVRQQAFDLILLDILMPGIRGDQVLAALKSDPALRHIPVIVISGDQDLDLIAHCIQLGAADYLGKPFNATILHARVNACLEQKRLRDAEQAYLRMRLQLLSTATDHPAAAHDPAIRQAIQNLASLDAVDQTLQAMLNRLEEEQRERRRAEEELRALNLVLEQRVAERTLLAEQRADALKRSEAALRRQTNLLLAILNSMGDAVVVTDAEGRLIHHNPAAVQILGDRLTSLLPNAPNVPVAQSSDGRCWLTPRELPFARALRGEAVDAAEVRLPVAGAHPEQWLSITARPLRDVGGLNGSVAIVRDVTEAKRAEAALRASEERYALAAQGANDGLWDWDLVNGRIYFAPRWKAMLGYDDDEIGTSPDEWFSRIHPDDRERVELRLLAHTRRLITSFELEYRMLHRDGNYRWMLCRGMAVWDENGRATRVVGSQTDITARKRAEEQLAYGALHDALTGLPNRTLFMDRLSLALKRSKREKYLFAVLFLDLDRFKTINDSLGHAAGDELLVAVARRLESILRPGDTVARLGSDEFAVILDHLEHPEDAEWVVERIQQALRAPLMIRNRTVYTTASIGLVLSNQGYDHPEEMARDADTAMYQAKMGRRARHVVFDPDMRRKALSHFQLENDLRDAIERGELLVYYQPIVALADGRIVGVEALARWMHPHYGLIPPDQFIPLAEEAGLINCIGQWVLQEACRQLRAWQIRYPQHARLWVNVNLSAHQLAQPDLTAQVAETIARNELSPHALKLEITENTFITHRETATAQLNELRSLGVGVCIDDFGTGYSSLGYLSQFPVDTLKIDRVFIGRLGMAREHREIVKAIVALAHSLGMTVVAEGVETTDQANELRALRCEYAQGWLFGRALPPDQLERLLADERS